VEENRELLSAIREVETGGEQDANNALGDGGDSLGSYQIQFNFWLDAINYCPELRGVYEDVRKPRYAEKVICSYWSRYCPDGTREDKARIFNGGPRGNQKQYTKKYWGKVSAVLRRQANPVSENRRIF
jgi:hypothetical protein